MTLEFFMQNYNLLDFKINKAQIKDNKLYLNINYEVFLELIANGYRPEMDMDINKLFIFNVDISNHTFKKPYVISNVNYDNNILSIELNKVKIKIKDEVVVE